MELVLQNTGTTEGFLNWLTAFKELQQSLLIEVDLKNEKFISKGYTLDKALVKRGEITFEEAGYSVSYVKDSKNKKRTLEEWNAEYDMRIQIGIFLTLAKVIEVVDFFSKGNHEMVVKFNVYKDGGAGDELHAMKIVYRSNRGTMTIPDSNLAEFETISDEKWDVINNIDNLQTFEVTQDTIAAFKKMSGIFSADAKKDMITLYTKKTNDGYALFAMDKSTKSYDFLLGYKKNDETPDEDTMLTVFRGPFLMGLKSDKTEENDGSVVFMISSTNRTRIRVINSNRFVTVLASTKETEQVVRVERDEDEDAE